MSFLWFWVSAFGSLRAQVEDRYIEVTGTAEMEIVPDRIHYIIEIREYFAEEFDGHSKPEEYRTKVPLKRIEKDLRKSLLSAGISDSDIQTQEVGDYWRQEGREFLVSKRFDITLHSFGQIDGIIRHVDAKGVNTMYIGEMENDSMAGYHQRGKIEALKAAERKAAYMVAALGKRLGPVLRIVENPGSALRDWGLRSCLKFLAILKRLNFQGAVSGFCLPIGGYLGACLRFSRQIAWLSSFEKRCAIPRNPHPMA